LPRSASCHRFFAVIPPGFEEVARNEFLASGIRGCVTEPGGISFSGAIEDLYRANLRLRTPTRILVRIGSFRASYLTEIVDHVARYPWEVYLIGSDSVRVRAASHKSRLYHTGAVAERILGGISRRLGRPVHPASGEDGPLILVRILGDSCEVSVDSSGAPLHRRGYRIAVASAPIRENLAAGILLVLGWTGDAPFLDPLCGSGTFVIEAALMASGIAPGLSRSFACETWRNFDPEAWHVVRAEAADLGRPDSTGGMFGRDQDPEAVDAARGNAERAGVRALTDFAVCGLEDLKSPATRPGLIVANPPYGVRIASSDTHGFCRRFGEILSRRFTGWRCAVLLPAWIPDHALGRPVRTLVAFSHGGIRVRLVEFMI